MNVSTSVRPWICRNAGTLIIAIKTHPMGGRGSESLNLPQLALEHPSSLFDMIAVQLADGFSDAEVPQAKQSSDR